MLAPAKGASVVARLDTGDPWIVERPYRKGRVAILAGPVDAEGGTLPVNPDFVPWAHELIFRLADADAGAGVRPPRRADRRGPRPAPAGVRHDPRRDDPDGTTARPRSTRADGKARARFDDTGEPGLYQIRLPDPPGGSAYAPVAADGRESDPRPLEPAEAETLAQGWPLTFEADAGPTRRPRSSPPTAGGGTRSGVPASWPPSAASASKVWLTRQLVMGRGIADLA